MHELLVCYLLRGLQLVKPVRLVERVEPQLGRFIKLVRLWKLVKLRELLTLVEPLRLVEPDSSVARH